MSKLLPVGRVFFAIAIVAFGIQHLVYGDFVTRVVPGWPTWIPGRPMWAYAVGVALIAAGLAVLFQIRARLAALLLGAMCLLSFVCLSLPLAAGDRLWGGLWTNALKLLALSGGAFIVAGTTEERRGASSGFERTIGSLELFIPAGRFFLAVFLILGGIQHFIFGPFVAQLVPAWIPGQLFWTYFAGVALIAGGVGLMLRRTLGLAALLVGIMIFLWVILLHIPRAMADLHNANETTAVFEALAFSGIAFMLAAINRRNVRA